MTLIENFVSRKTVKEKLNDRRIAEPPMDENSKKIRELTEAMRAEGYQDPQQDDGGLGGSQEPLDKDRL